MKQVFTFFTLLACTLSYAQMDFVPGEVLVQFDPNSDPTKVLSDYEEIRGEATGIQLVKLLSEPMNIYRVKISESADGQYILGRLRNNSAVLNAQFNHYVYPRETVPNDPQFNQQWQHVNGNDSDIDTDLAWDITTGGLTALGDSIVVCVIEGGNLQHPDLIDNAWYNYGEIPNNGIDDDGNGYIDDFRGWNVQSEDDDGVYQGGHGTQVMGMIGAKGDNDLGVAGANWNVKIMSVAGENIFNEASVIEAYTYPLIQRRLYDETDGEFGAFVVATNASWGIDNGNPDDVPLWSAFYDTLGQSGILNCGATANNNVNIDVVGDIPTAADSDYMISVTATNNNDVRTFSGFGVETVDLGAPGENIYTTQGGAGYGSTSGTSFASPLTAGVIALMYSVPCEDFAQQVHDDPQYGSDYVRAMLFEGVDPVENLENETVTGGRLNAFNSISLMLSNCGDSDFCPVSQFELTVENDTVHTFSWNTIGVDSMVIRIAVEGTTDWQYYTNLEGEPLVFDDLETCVVYEVQAANNCQGAPVDELEYDNTIIFTSQGCCLAAESLTSNDTSEMETSFSWEMSFGIDSYDVYYQLEGSTEWTEAGNSEIGEFTISALEECAAYQIAVLPNCAAGDFALASYIDIQTLGCGHCTDHQFCESAGDPEVADEEFIQIVEIGEYVNTTGNDGGYALFENTGIELMVNESYDATVTPGFAGGSFSEFIRVWIDFDQNGLFDADELVMESEQASANPLEGSIAVPADAILGNTRLRIIMEYVGFGGVDPQDPCLAYNYGETEDYCLTIIDNNTNTSDLNSDLGFELFPNPNKGSFQIRFDGSPEIVNQNMSMKVMDITGKVVGSHPVSSGLNSIDTNLPSGFYTFQIISQDRVFSSGKFVVN